MLSSILKYPILKILLPFIFGIVLGLNWFCKIDQHLFATIAFALLVIVLIGVALSQKYRYRFVSGITFLISFFVVGFLFVQLKTQQIQSLPYINKTVDALVQVSEVPTESAKAYKIIVDVKMYKDSVWVKTSGKSMVYVSKKSIETQSIIPGKLLVGKFQFSKVEPNRNPNEFNYAKYLEDNGIYSRAYLKNQTVSDGDYNVYIASQRLRLNLLSLLNETAFSDGQKALISSLVMGYKDYLDDETLDNFTASGLMHMLSISGLHVGIVYLIISTLLFYNRKRSTLSSTVKIVVIILAIWGYALFTGLSPSVFRAAVMFSFISLGSIMNREVSSFNMLFLAALILLLINPFWIRSVGFQMSFGAVFSILAFYQPLYRLITLKNKLLDWAWQVIVISTSAQILIAPMIVYYFGRFSLVFIFSNLIAAPLVIMLLAGGILLLLLLLIGIQFPIYNFIFGLWVNAFLWNAQFWGTLPFAEIVNIPLHPFIFLMIVLFTLTIFDGIERWTFNHTKIAGCFLLISMISYTAINFQRVNRTESVKYQMQTQQCVEVISGRESLFVSSDSLSAYELKNLRNNMFKNGLKKREFLVYKR